MMSFVEGDRIFEAFLEGTLHRETQVEAQSVSLTAGSLYRATAPGSLDFGGGEFELGEREPLEPVKRDPDHDYGWWNLEGDTYLLELNETLQLEPGQQALLQPHEHLLWNGAHHPTLMLSPDETNVRLTLPLTVPRAGIALKENARVSALRLRESEASPS